MHKSWFLFPVLLLSALACTKSKNDSPDSTKQPVTAEQTLSKLVVIADQLEPAFDPYVNEYSLAGGETYKNKISINTAPVNPNLHVVINGVPLRSDFTTDPMPLVAGANVFAIDLVDSAGTTVNTYKLNVQRIQELPDEILADLSTSDGLLTPPYSPYMTNYELVVSASTSVLTVSPLPNYPDECELEINGLTIEKQKGGYDVTVNPGSTTVTIIVKGRSGRSKTYTITVTRPAA
ncbi:cadherin-like beta sandwich domain-containing protein [Oligoflexus tunisiensis]|uniref:cadherin-like beta sandwich domain-containing protein n=1 Tax=Oligoflexus tunisiensis TaxID=708132 RepID=UPI000B2C2A8F|nr:cadherin-like beta sandwich domain-containing protein [Oligoflexus tunisiensis]